jgi:hypothetical protein
MLNSKYQDFNININKISSIPKIKEIEQENIINNTDKMNDFVQEKEKKIEKVHDMQNFEKMKEIEKQNKIINEIFVDIQNIDSNMNNLENILENEDQINMISDDNDPLAELEKVLPNINIIENKTNDDLKNENVEEKLQKKENEDIKNNDLHHNDSLYDLCLLKEKLLMLEEKFSEYLKQYEKEWESPTKRTQWVNNIIYKNAIKILFLK